MEVKDMVGMMSTGALLALGVVFVGGKLSGTDANQEPNATMQIPAQVQMTAAPQAVQQPIVTEIVTSADMKLLGRNTAAQIDRLVALSQQGLDHTDILTPEQEEIVSFFEKTAREMNQQDRVASTGAVQFSNMAVLGLNVKYFYRVPEVFETINTSELLQTQREHVRQTLCGNYAIRTLLSDYGFAYTYTYVSSDSRQLGQISADASVCA